MLGRTGVTQLFETGQVVPLCPSLGDALVLHTIDCDIRSFEDLATRRKTSHWPELRAPKVVPRGHLVSLGHKVEQRFGGIGERDELCLQERHEVLSRVDHGLSCSGAVALEVACKETKHSLPVLRVDCVDQCSDE